MLSALRLPGFRWVASVYAFDYLVELASSVALMVLVYDATDSPLAAAAMLTCKQVLPGILTASLGKLLDVVTIRIGLTVAYALAAAVLAVLAVSGYSWLLYVLAIVAGTTGAAVRALLRTAVARSTTGQDLRAANGLLNVLMGIVALLGPALGALLVSQMTTSAALAVTAVGAAVLSVGSLAMPAVVGNVHVRDVEEPEDEEDEPVATAPVSRRVSTWGLLALGGLVTGLFAMDEPALLAYAKDSLDAGVGGYGAILTAWGAGMIVGSLVYGKLLNRSMPVIFAGGAAVAAAGYVGLGLAPTIVVSCALAVVGGSGNGVLWVALVTAVQESAEDGEQAATAARLEGISMATPAVGIIVGGIVAEVVSPRASLLIPGALSLLAIAVWLFTQRDALWPGGPDDPPATTPTTIAAAKQTVDATA